MINVKKPRVRIFSGRVRTIKTGRIKILIMPNNTDAITAVNSESTLIPGINIEESKITVVTISQRVKTMSIILPEYFEQASVL